MWQLRNKTILILSPQAWGTMFLSKHHYAVELARLGNRVYYLNPPETSEKLSKGSFEILPADAMKGLFIIHHSLNFPYKLKFRLKPVYDFFMGRHLKMSWGKSGGRVLPWSPSARVGLSHGD